MLAKVIKVVSKGEKDVAVSAWGRLQKHSLQALLNRAFWVLTAQIPGQPGRILQSLIAPVARSCEVTKLCQMKNGFCRVLALGFFVFLLFCSALQSGRE